MKQILTLSVLVLFFVMNIAAQSPAIIPLPKEIKTRNGDFSLNKDCTLKFDASNEEVTRIAGFFNEYLESIYGFKAEGKRNAKTISFKLQNNLKKLGKEGYRLKVEKNNIEIEAFAPNGLFYGMQSLKQLLPLEATNNQLNIPCIEIKDEPRFAWRGNMLDVGRHFFPGQLFEKIYRHPGHV